MTRRALCLVALAFGWVTIAAAQQITITLRDGRQLTAAGSFSGEELSRKVLELDGVILPANPQERPSDPPTQRTGTSRISGRIVNSNGTPLRQATVRASRGASSDGDDRLNGGYEFRDLPGLAIDPRQQTERPEAWVRAAAAVRPVRPRRIRDNQAADGIDISLPRGGVITGRVLNEFGEPVPDFRVLPVRRSIAGPASADASGRAGVTNDIGEYRLVGLLPGQYFDPCHHDLPRVLK